MAKRRTKAQIEQERIDRAHREWLRTQRSRPRIEIPSEYPGESIFVHQKVHDKFTKNRGIFITSYRVEGGTGGKLILEYTTAAGGKGSVELLDLGQMPV